MEEVERRWDRVGMDSQGRDSNGGDSGLKGI